jgi:hypothetical protein
MSNWAGAKALAVLVRPKAGISMSSPNGAETLSCSSSPRSIAIVGIAPFPATIPALNRWPSTGGLGLGAGARSVVVSDVSLRCRSGGGTRSAARVEIPSRTSMTTTKRRAATPVA